VRNGKAQILFDAKEHTRRETTSVMSWLARSNAPSKQALIADILAHSDTNTDLEMESGHAEDIAKFADAKHQSHGAAVENSLNQMNRVDSKLHAGYRIVAAKSREVAITDTATPIFEHMSNLAVGQDPKYVADARQQGREMSDHFRSLPHYVTTNDLRRKSVETLGFHPEVQAKIDRAQKELFKDHDAFVV
jgi:hypothetical protein